MARIETERYITSQDDPSKLVYAGRRAALEVYEELKTLTSRRQSFSESEFMDYIQRYYESIQPNEELLAESETQTEPNTDIQL